MTEKSPDNGDVVRPSRTADRFSTLTVVVDEARTWVEGASNAVSRASGASPVPDSVTSCRPLLAELEIVSVPLSDPAAEGLNATLTVHVPAGGSVLGQSFCSSKSDAR